MKKSVLDVAGGDIVRGLILVPLPGQPRPLNERSRTDYLD